MSHPLTAVELLALAGLVDLAPRGQIRVYASAAVEGNSNPTLVAATN